MPDDQRCSNAADGNLLAETVALAQKRLRRTLGRLRSSAAAVVSR